MVVKLMETPKNLNRVASNYCSMVIPKSRTLKICQYSTQFPKFIFLFFRTDILLIQMPMHTPPSASPVARGWHDTPIRSRPPVICVSRCLQHRFEFVTFGRNIDAVQIFEAVPETFRCEVCVNCVEILWLYSVVFE